MLKNYLLVALRTLRRQKGYATINVLGLAVGVACCLFLLLFVRDELSYDRFHEDADNIFRINAQFDKREIGVTPALVGPLLANELPGVEAVTRINNRDGLVRYGDKVFDEDGFFYVDSSFFDVMTHQLLVGDAETALSRPNTVVLTESMARKYFGESNPIGKTLIRNNTQEFEVTGIVADVPANSHYTFNFLASFSEFDLTRPNVWSNANYYTYVRTRDATAAAAFPDQLAHLLDRLEAEGQEPWTLVAKPITSIHLYDTAEYGLSANGDIRYVYGFALVALLILLIACINYMNLATARSAQRAEEIGLRKSLGAFRGQLVGQFYSESAVLTLGGILLALGIVALGMPWFNNISGKALTVATLGEPLLLSLILGIFLIVSVVAGSYPALHLSGFEPVTALRGGSKSGRGTVLLRKGLVVFQFGISVVLIVGTVVVLTQLRFLGSQDLGFDKEHLIVLPLGDQLTAERYPAMKEALVQRPMITAAAGINQIPGELGWTSSFWGEGMGDDENFFVKGLPADLDVADGLGVRLIAGSAFPQTAPEPDSANFLFLVNETTVKRLGWTPTEAIGRPVAVDSRRGEVVGVVQDFHFRSLHEAIEPLAIWYDPGNVYNLAIRLAPGDTRAAMDQVQAVWGQFITHRPFSYRFLDDVYDDLYRTEQRMGQIISVFAFFAILVACLGLFGLAAFTAQQRRKEIGVRKVLGASVPNLVALLSKDFLLLVSIAFVLAAPIAYLALNSWLDDFAYRIEISPAIFLMAGLASLGIALATVSYQAVKAAMADPVTSLRSE